MRGLNEAFIGLKNVGIYPNGIIMLSIVVLLSILILLSIRKLYFRLITKWLRESGLDISEILASSIKTPTILGELSRYFTLICSVQEFNP